MILKMLKHLIFHQSDDDAEKISKAVFNLDEFENLLGAGSYFDEPIGRTDQCLTHAQMVELILDSDDSDLGNDSRFNHLRECTQCRNVYEEVRVAEMEQPPIIDLTLASNTTKPAKTIQKANWGLYRQK